MTYCQIATICFNRWGSLQRSPDPLAGLRGTGREREGKEERDTDGRGAKGDKKGGREEKESRRGKGDGEGEGWGGKGGHSVESSSNILPVPLSKLLNFLI